jgi:hypothetical protein
MLCVRTRNLYTVNTRAYQWMRPRATSSVKKFLSQISVFILCLPILVTLLAHNSLLDVATLRIIYDHGILCYAISQITSIILLRSKISLSDLCSFFK